MRCENCNHELEEDARFCSKCGQELSQSEGEELDLIEGTEEELYSDDRLEETQVIGNIEGYIEEDGLDQSLEEKRFLDQEDYQGDYPYDESYYDEDYYPEEEEEAGPRRYFLMGLGLAVLLIGLIAFSFMRNRSDKDLAKDQLIEDFIQAVESEDVRGLQGILEAADGELSIDKEGIQAYLRYMKDHPKALDRQKKALEEQSSYYDQEDKGQPDRMDSNIVLLKKDGDYVLEVKSYYILIKSNMENLEIRMGDRVLEGTDTFGPFMPGKYNIKALARTDFQDMETAMELELYQENPSEDRISMDLQLSFETRDIRISSNHMDGEILINGRPLGKKLSDLEGGLLKDLSNDMTIQLEVETAFGSFKSEEFLVGEEGDSLNIELDLANQANKEAIMEAVNKHLQEDKRAKEELDPSIYSNTISPELDKHIAIIRRLEEEGEILEIKLDRVAYDLDSIIVKKLEDKYYGVVSLKYGVDFSKSDSMTVESWQEDRIRYVELVFEEKLGYWEVYNLQEKSDFKAANVKEYRL